MNFNFIITYRWIPIFVNFLAFSILGLSQTKMEKLETIRIKNFGQINMHYYRGGQPKAKDFKVLKEMGIRTVINLRKGGPRQEEAWAQNAGMKYFNIPLSTTRPATKEQTDEFLMLVQETTHLPVFVHCAAGRHRTGAMTAIYRIARDSWTADMAYKEMKQYGFYSFPNHGSLKEFVYRYFRSASETGRTNSPAHPEFPGMPTFAIPGAD